MKKRLILQMTDKELDKMVKISGTQYDRKRKLTDRQVASAKRMFTKNGKSLHYIADKFGVDYRTIRYHLDETYRKSRISQANTPDRKGASAKVYSQSLEERVAYKRKLIAQGRLSI